MHLARGPPLHCKQPKATTQSMPTMETSNRTLNLLTGMNEGHSSAADAALPLGCNSSLVNVNATSSNSENIEECISTHCQLQMLLGSY